MNLYIKYIDGKIVDHPMLEDNLKQIYPDFDPTNIPDTLKLFERINAPLPGPYAYMEVSYQLDQDNIVRDVYTEVPFSAEEKTQLIEYTMAQAHTKGWIFNETICSWEPSVPYPNDGKVYSWSEELENWEEITSGIVPVISTPATA
jgi:hypothetical protein